MIINNQEIHFSVNLERITEYTAKSEDAANPANLYNYWGLCIKCGNATSGVVPGPKKYPCKFCNSPNTLYSAHQLLVFLVGSENS